MLITMDMSQGMEVKNERDWEYDQEVMRGEWNPVVIAMQEVVDELASQMIKRHAMPPVLAEVDVEAFLGKMYAAQR